jgi:hypothetical protein
MEKLLTFPEATDGIVLNEINGKDGRAVSREISIDDFLSVFKGKTVKSNTETKGPDMEFRLDKDMSPQDAGNELHDLSLEIQRKNHLTYSEAFQRACEKFPHLEAIYNPRPERKPETEQVLTQKEAGDWIDGECKKLMDADDIDYPTAFDQVIAENPETAKVYLTGS